MADPSKCPYGHHSRLGPEAVEGEPQCPHLRKKYHGTSRKGEDTDWAQATGQDFKAFFAQAYDELALATGSSAKNAAAARVLVSHLGYTERELRVVRDDAWLMQGTGNPHLFANIQPGESVLDLGSGFGIDAFIAADKAGATGRVIGIDISAEEVIRAIRRAWSRRLRNVDFRLGDIEDIPLDDCTVDCVISNGGFCLVPDKPRAFSEVFRVLRPGGRMSISCTTKRCGLDPSKKWPSCMIVFATLSELPAMLQQCGYTDVVIDDNNSRMDIWDDVKEDMREHGETSPATPVDKVTIHYGDPKYDFLSQYNMNDLFARVNIFGRKPA